MPLPDWSDDRLYGIRGSWGGQFDIGPLFRDVLTQRAFLGNVVTSPERYIHASVPAIMAGIDVSVEPFHGMMISITNVTNPAGVPIKLVIHPDYSAGNAWPLYIRDYQTNTSDSFTEMRNGEVYTFVYRTNWAGAPGWYIFHSSDWTRQEVNRLVTEAFGVLFNAQF
jgi:hypothetical protein